MVRRRVGQAGRTAHAQPGTAARVPAHALSLALRQQQHPRPPAPAPAPSHALCPPPAPPALGSAGAPPRHACRPGRAAGSGRAERARRLGATRAVLALVLGGHGARARHQQAGGTGGRPAPPRPARRTLILPSSRAASLASSAAPSCSTRHSRPPGGCSKTKYFSCSTTCHQRPDRVVWRWARVGVMRPRQVAGQSAASSRHRGTHPAPASPRPPPPHLDAPARGVQELLASGRVPHVAREGGVGDADLCTGCGQGGRWLAGKADARGVGCGSSSAHGAQEGKAAAPAGRRSTSTAQQAAPTHPPSHPPTHLAILLFLRVLHHCTHQARGVRAAASSRSAGGHEGMRAAAGTASGARRAGRKSSGRCGCSWRLHCTHRCPESSAGTGWCPGSDPAFCACHH